MKKVTSTLRFFKPATLCVALLMLCISPYCRAQNNAPLSENAPEDKPVSLTSNKQLKELDKKIEPYVKQARESLPQAKQKFLNGLNEGDVFFLTIRVFDKDGKFEQVFVRVKTWEGNKISGTIANQLSVVKEYTYNQLVNFKEKEVLDWLITKADGTEEGNFVGRFLDSQQ